MVADEWNVQLHRSWYPLATGNAYVYVGPACTVSQTTERNSTQLLHFAANELKGLKHVNAVRCVYRSCCRDSVA